MPTDNFAPVLDPTKARVLAHIGSLRWFHGGRGCELFDAEQRAYLDLGAGYGACALGHNPAVAVQALQRALAAEEPALVQPYQAPAALELAELLSRLTTLEHVCFGTSGADVVEAAMKLARVRTRRPWIVTASDAYHGQTLGALAASGRSQWPGGPGPAAFGCSQVPFGDASALAAELTARAGQVAAVMLEPIQGEGGVIVPPSGYLAEVATLCRARGVLLIVDEIQTGLGRTGRLLACEHEGVRPDILLLSKALGGGVFPLGAMLVDRDAWDPRFGMAHGTTFANHNLACRVGLATVDAVARPEFLAGVERKGALLGRLLTGLQARHPGVITAVRGRGLLAAIELRQPPGEGLISGYMYHHGLLAYAIAQAAAERHGVLFLPTLARGNVLRVTPPLVIADAEIERAIAALDEVLAPVSRGDVGGLLRSLGATAPRHADPDVAALQLGRIELPEQKIRVPAPAGRRFGFIIHYATLADLPTIEPSLASAQPGEIAAVAGWTARMPAGIVHRTGVLATIAGVPVDGLILAVPMLPEHMLRLGPKQMSEEITRAVDLAAAHGASVVGLGGYTTAYSRRGLDVAGRGPAITTGNTLTAVMAVRAVAAALRELPGLRAGCFEEADVAIVGARGSVGALLARLIARMRPRRLVLIGRPGGDEPRVRALAASLAGEVEVASDTAPLVDCSVVITATGSAQPALRGAPIAAGTLICDVARPFDAPRELRARTDVTVINGGLVALPDASLRFGAGNIQGFPDGVQLACLAETLLLTLADTREDVGIGDDISLATADMVTRLAGQHDFRLAPLATPRPGTM